MPDYRIYCLDERNHIDFADWVEASSVEEAIALVRRMKPRAHMCEIWQKERLVAKIDAKGVVKIHTLEA